MKTVRIQVTAKDGTEQQKAFSMLRVPSPLRAGTREVKDDLSVPFATEMPDGPMTLLFKAHSSIAALELRVERLNDGVCESSFNGSADGAVLMLDDQAGLMTHFLARE